MTFILSLHNPNRLSWRQTQCALHGGRYDIPKKSVLCAVILHLNIKYKTRQTKLTESKRVKKQKQRTRDMIALEM